MILEYAHDGNLRDYLRNNFVNLRWKDKLNILKSIANNLFNIHKLNYIHRDLHSGNILQFYIGGFGTKITDLGLSQSITNSKSSYYSKVFGVLPYIAPEILDGRPYTTGSDIYSFGIIMTEVSTGKPPYGNISHDEELALAICNGSRPSVAKGTPKCYIDLVNQCLDANPEKRPSSKVLLETIRDWQFPSDNYSRLKKSFKEPEVYKEFIDADNIIFKKSIPEITIHSEANYTGRPMCFYNLPEPKNSTKVQIEDPEGNTFYS
jgi:serine/threonine protein kinase